MTTQIGTATDFLDFIDILDGFLCDAGHAWGLVDHADGNGRLTDLAGGVSSVHESITVTMLNATDFTVQGSVSGSLGYGAVGTPFSSSKCAFTVESGSQVFIAGDYWTFSTSPAWTLLRRALLTEFTATGGGTSGGLSFHCLNDGILDPGVSTLSWETTGAPPLEYIVTLESAITAVEYAIDTASAENSPADWTLDRWNGSAWVALDTQSGVTWQISDVGTWRVFTIASPTSAARYRWRISARNGDRIDVRQFAIRSATGGINRTEEVVAWQAPGDDEDRTFYCAMKPLYRDDRDYFTLELLAMTAWSAGAELSAQAGLHRNNYLPLWNTTMDYWIVARGSGVRGVVKLGTQYESFSIGFIDPYFPPNEYPLPLMLGGSLTIGTSTQDYGGKLDTTTLRHSNATREHSAYPMAAVPTGIAGSPNLYTESNQQRASLRLRLIDAGWRGFVCNEDGNYVSTNILADSAPIKWGTILPYYRGFALTARSLADQPILWPVVIGTVDDLYGELPGIRAVSGDGVSAESIITEDGVDWLVVPNVFRVGFNDFYAFKLD